MSLFHSNFVVRGTQRNSAFGPQLLFYAQPCHDTRGTGHGQRGLLGMTLMFWPAVICLCPGHGNTWWLLASL